MTRQQDDSGDAEYRPTVLGAQEFSDLLGALDAAPEPNEHTRRAAARMRRERADRSDREA
ncbi:hypothetical protein GL263_22565 [Streptomyces durbertensis]|uniref:Uncharacterized protein n=1 Tax=Streptomyces durbertensis TaxID=2448886 RepID=A0ABR6EMK3_9ACTN|nr:hypothetical protein [Streptomyces durbertensis]MBB1246317.1 hypothetical protein [Streptomyces durbertensis]